MLINQNSDFIFGFEAIMTNPNGDPDQENKPRMDYETGTVLVSDARRKRDCREFLKKKGYFIFVDTLADKKVPMDIMFEHIINVWLGDKNKIDVLLKEVPKLSERWLLGSDASKYMEAYEKIKKDKKKKDFTEFNNLLFTEIIKRELIDIRLFGSAMAVEGVSRTYTGPVQINWGYSLHPVEMAKSNTITSIMNDDNSTFGKKHKLYYALIAHYGTINKYSAALTGMTEEDRDIFRKALIQGMTGNQTDSKQGQIPLFYLEILYSSDFDGYLGDLRRFMDVSYDEEKPIRSISDLNIDFGNLTDVITQMKQKKYIEKVIGWQYPFIGNSVLQNIPEYETVDLWMPLKNLMEG